MEGLTKDNSGRIGFVVSCLYASALDIDEMKEWVGRIYQEEGTPPVYFVDLLEFKPPLYLISKTIGFTPNWPYSEDAELALFGITFQRGRSPHDCPITKDEASEKLRKYPVVEEMFRREFPFIELPR